MLGLIIKLALLKFSPSICCSCNKTQPASINKLSSLEEVSANSDPPKVIIQNVTIGQNTFKIDASSYTKEDDINFSDNSVSFEYLAFWS